MMNRKQKRNFIKAAKKKGIDRSLADVYLRIKEKEAAQIEFADGDKAKLNLSVITGRPDYKRMSASYRKFVESNTDTVFTVKHDDRGGNLKNVVCLEEDPMKWLFWTGDLTKITE